MLDEEAQAAALGFSGVSRKYSRLGSLFDKHIVYFTRYKVKNLGLAG